MADFSSIDPQTLAQQLATYDIMSMQNQLKTKSSTMNAQKKALDALKTALGDFRTAMSGLNGTNSGMLKNAAPRSRAPNPFAPAAATAPNARVASRSKTR